LAKKNVHNLVGHNMAVAYFVQGVQRDLFILKLTTRSNDIFSLLSEYVRKPLQNTKQQKKAQFDS
jgi:hypothetical protein